VKAGKRDLLSPAQREGEAGRGLLGFSDKKDAEYGDAERPSPCPLPLGCAGGEELAL